MHGSHFPHQKDAIGKDCHDGQYDEEGYADAASVVVLRIIV
jgi:hypothetical protein